MKHAAFSSVVLRALINGRNNCNRSGTAVATATVMPFMAAEMSRHCRVLVA
ncbi:uncharacterized protein DS421_10g306570 [Arachis hypogaea]|nr:uncharacterized protein DS421_10g306570 [Arachis hypogaea]